MESSDIERVTGLGGEVEGERMVKDGVCQGWFWIPV